MRQMRALFVVLLAAAITVALTSKSRAVLYLYEPFDYVAGQNLGGVDADPDPGGPAGTPVGQTRRSTTNFGGGTSYTWYARGTASNYQSNKDALISAGSLSYPGLALSQGNSVSYGSALDNTVTANSDFQKTLYGDTVALPVAVSSGSLYASFLIRIKSEIEDGTAAADRFSPAGFVVDTSTLAQAGSSISLVQSGSSTTMGSFFVRRDPDDATLSTNNFSPGKSSGDGIGEAATGPSAGWQRSIGGSTNESNQFGNTLGQPEPVFADSNTWQTFFVVLKYEFDAINTSSDDFDPPGSSPVANGQNDTVSLWMNPGSGTLGVANGEILASQNPTGNLGSYFAAVDAYGTATSDIASAINSFALLGHRQTTNNTAAVELDELRIGTTWADVTPAAPVGVLGDYNDNGVVDAADYVLWRDNPGNYGGDPTGYNAWRANFGATTGSGIGSSAAVPEPITIWVGSLAAIFACSSRRRW